MSLSPYIFDCKATKRHYLDGSEGWLEQEDKLQLIHIFPGLTGSWIYNKSQSISSSITLPECQIYVSVLVFVVDGIWLWPKTDCLTAYLDCRARGSGPCKRRTMPMPAAKQCIKTDHKRVQQNTYTKQEKSHSSNGAQNSTLANWTKKTNQDKWLKKTVPGIRTRDRVTGGLGSPDIYSYF